MTGQNNFSVVLLTSEARTATVSTVNTKNSLHNGGHIIIDMTAVTATGSVTPVIEAKDKASGKYYPLLTGAAITGTGTVVLRVHPDLTPVANLVADDIIPADFRVTLTHLNAVSMTYTVGVSLV